MTHTRSAALIVLLGLVGNAVSGQPLFRGPRSAALAGASAAMAHSSYGLDNPASLATHSQLGIAVAASRSFGLKELDHALLTGLIGSRNTSIAVTAESFGFEQYRLLTGNITAAGRLMTSPANLAARVTYRRLTVKGYGSLEYYGLAAGIHLDLGPRLDVGAFVENVVRSRSDMAESRRRVVLGIGVAPAQHLRLLADAVTTEAFDPSLRIGIEAILLRRVALRGGFSTFPPSFSTGIGVRLGNLGVDTGGLRHRALGWARSVGLTLSR